MLEWDCKKICYDKLRAMGINLKQIENSFEGEFDKLDGISYFSDDFWFNVRGSNTEPMLRLNAEAINQKTLDSIIEKISNIID